jgi:hypothetical protein
MANINNSQLSKELIDGAKIQTSFDKIPTQLADKVVPVMEVNPKMLRMCNVAKSSTATNATSATLYTTPTDRDFYLCGLALSTIKDVTSTSLSSGITTTINGASVTLLSIASLSLTVQNSSTNLVISPPILVDRGVTIAVTNSTNVANITSRASLVGYTIDQG